jgi:hypothetical protein
MAGKKAPERKVKLRIRSHATPEPKPLPVDPRIELFKSLLELIARKTEKLSLVDFANDWLTEEVTTVVPEGEEILVSFIKTMISTGNHEGLCTILNSLNDFGSWLEDMMPAPRKELLNIFTGVLQRFWENIGMVDIISQVFAQVPNEAIDALREAEIDNDSFDYVVKKMFVYVQENC